jgi:hypothetical protein
MEEPMAMATTKYHIVTTVKNRKTNRQYVSTQQSTMVDHECDKHPKLKYIRHY